MIMNLHKQIVKQTRLLLMNNVVTKWNLTDGNCPWRAVTVSVAITIYLRWCTKYDLCLKHKITVLDGTRIFTNRTIKLICCFAYFTSAANCLYHCLCWCLLLDERFKYIQLLRKPSRYSFKHLRLIYVHPPLFYN